MSDEELDIDDTLEDDGELIDWQLPLCFMKKRHKEKIEGIACLPQSWRMKERVSNINGLTAPRTIGHKIFISCKLTLLRECCFNNPLSCSVGYVHVSSISFLPLAKKISF